jgi:phytoene dehydrogenase-like protein
VHAKTVVVATDQTAAAQLIPTPTPRGWCGTACFYFAADKPPVSDPVLVLNGETRGPINHLCVPSNVTPTYAPSGKHLVSANVVGSPQSAEHLLRDVREQLAEWFGLTANDWKHLRTDWIPHALPDQTLASGGLRQEFTMIKPGLYACGDYRETSSINGALASGRKTAEAIAKDLARPSTVERAFRPASRPKLEGL